MADLSCDFKIISYVNQRFLLETAFGNNSEVRKV